MARLHGAGLTITHDRVLVTGGAGFIGSHLVDALVARGASVTVLDDFSTGKVQNLRSLVEAGDVRLIEGSVLDAEVVDRLVGKVQAVYHLAAAVGVRHIVNDPIKSALTNVRGTENVLGAALRYGTKVLLASSSEVYGKNPQAPFREDSARILGPTWIHRWSYSTSKAMDEHLAFAYFASGLPVVVVRYFNSYGPRIDKRGYGSVVARFTAQALAGDSITVHGDGSQTRCFTYVDDTVRGTMLALETPAAFGRVFNIGASQEIAIRELAEKIRDIVGSRSDIHNETYESYYGPGFEDTSRRVPDTTLARDVLSFTADVPLAEGLERTVRWCRENFDREDTLG